MLRAVAEQENLRKRTEREKEQTRRFGIASFARDLLSTADNLRRALEATPDDLEDADEWVRNMVVGVEMTERDLLAAMEKNGINRVDPAGEKFDYNLHQAMFEITDSGQEAGTVVQVLQPGYVLGDRLLRAAMVGVAKDPPPPAEAAGEDVPAEEEDAAEGRRGRLTRLRNQDRTLRVVPLHATARRGPGTDRVAIDTALDAAVIGSDIT